MQVLELIDDTARIVQPRWLAQAEAVHVQLRPNLPADYAGRLAQIAANGGRLIAVVKDDKVLGLALWRIIENTYEGVGCMSMTWLPMLPSAQKAWAKCCWIGLKREPIRRAATCWPWIPACSAHWRINSIFARGCISPRTTLKKRR